MANRFSSFLKKVIIGKDANLISLDEPYKVIKSLLTDRKVTGILDAGASNGRLSSRMLGLFPEAQAYAFEPNPMYRSELELLADSNERFHPVYAALSDKEGVLDLNITESPGSTSLFAPGNRIKRMNPKGSEVKRVESVNVDTIDNWVARNDVNEIELMKFDIQGGELNAFKGGERTLSDSTLVIYTEILFNRMYEGGAVYSELDLCLREYGFVLYDIFKPKYDENRLLMWANAIFIHAGRMGL